jgi:signal transduction histidine kinase
VKTPNPDEILVVDDTPASLKLLAAILNEAGYRVRLAPDGELAIRSALQRAPALILLDIKMPGMNGYEVCQRLKANERTRCIPIIFLSVLDDEHEKSLAFQLGAVDYVNKPVRAAEVLARVDTHLSLRRAQLELEARNAELEAARALLEQRVAERSAELEAANRKLLQSQKLESIGLLSGGVAHDFNNLLTPIRGYAELVRTSLREDDPLRTELAEIERAAERARELTQQLLAFSRKQIIEVKPVDLREIIRRAERILRRTIREDISIRLELAATPSIVRADAGQIELVLVNLSINAQDAMPEGGVLRIETVSFPVDESYAARHPGLSPGPHVMLAVSDTGVGMDQPTMARIFEPFFTTKEVGKGTGLGLSTAYGIITQHGGSINVHSEKGHGSTFKILLPQLEGAEAAPPREPVDLVLRGTETILVVEDNPMVRTLLGRLLPSLGYETLTAGGVEECLELVKTRTGSLHLLLTDVVMPTMNGRELYERVRLLRPELKVLFMSGYTTEVIGHHGVIEEGVHFLHKPFSRSALSIKIRAALEQIAK